MSHFKVPCKLAVTTCPLPVIHCSKQKQQYKRQTESGSAITMCLTKISRLSKCFRTGLFQANLNGQANLSISMQPWHQEGTHIQCKPGCSHGWNHFSHTNTALEQSHCQYEFCVTQKHKGEANSPLHLGYPFTPT